jgi:ankyrin repeat protein
VFAVKNNYPNVVDKLLSTLGIDPCEESRLLLFAIKRQHWDIVNKLLEDGRIDPSHRGYYLRYAAEDNLSAAASTGNLEMVIRLYNDPRIKSTLKDIHFLGSAADKGHIHIIKWFLENTNIDPSDNNNTILISASCSGHLDIVNLLIDKGVDPSTRNNNALIYASINGHLNVVKRLIQDLRVDPSDQDNEALNAASGNYHSNS